MIARKSGSGFRCVRQPASAVARRASRGFSTLDLLLAVALMGLAIAATSGMFVASKGHIVMKGREVETTQAARAAMDVLVRDLRLGGACLPVTGDFISLEGIDDGDQDEIITRTGLTRADLSCVRTASTEVTDDQRRRPPGGVQRRFRGRQ
jgi:type II secretory pathway component PulJ